MGRFVLLHFKGELESGFWAGVAQLVEQRFCKPQVVGSSPFSSSTFPLSVRMRDLERYPSGQRDQTVNLAAYAFEGSNPSLSTTGKVWK